MGVSSLVLSHRVACFSCCTCCCSRYILCSIYPYLPINFEKSAFSIERVGSGDETTKVSMCARAAEVVLFIRFACEILICVLSEHERGTWRAHEDCEF